MHDINILTFDQSNLGNANEIADTTIREEFPIIGICGSLSQQLRIA
jgi:hypothetical protein